MSWQQNVTTRLKMMKHEFRFAFYSPKHNDIALVRHIEVWEDKGDAEYVNHKREDGLYGQATRADIFEKRFPVYLGDIGLGSEYYELEKKLTTSANSGN